MRLIDADELLEHFESCVTNGRPLSNLYDLSEIIDYVESMPTIDAVPIGYIMQRADALIETNVYGAKVLYGLVMIWKGESHERISI